MSHVKKRKERKEQGRTERTGRTQRTRKDRDEQERPRARVVLAAVELQYNQEERIGFEGAGANVNNDADGDKVQRKVNRLRATESKRLCP